MVSAANMIHTQRQRKPQICLLTGVPLATMLPPVLRLTLSPEVVLALGSGTLRRAIKVYGGPVNRFAVDVLGRSRVSVWRWLNNREAIPLIVIHRLKMYLQFPHPTYTEAVNVNTNLPTITDTEEDSPYND